MIQLSCFQEPMKSKAPQLHLEYRFYKLLGQTGDWRRHLSDSLWTPGTNKS